MPFFLDTNILLRSIHGAHPQQEVTVTALNALALAGEDFYILPQNVREFWNVATRPIERNGLGFTPAQTEVEVQRIEELFTVLEDGLAVYHKWRRLVVVHQISGVQVHDAYIAAAMDVHRIVNLLTFNNRDFLRYGINAITPTELIESTS